MASCEKCWDDASIRAFSGPGKSQTDHYQDLIKERKDHPCSPEEQAGINASMCLVCKRWTIHQMIGKCVICGYE